MRLFNKKNSFPTFSTNRIPIRTFENFIKKWIRTKLQNELETLKNNILTNIDEDFQKYNEDKKQLETEYYSEINKIKM